MEKEKIYELVAENMKTIFAYSLSRVSRKEDAEDLAGDIVLAICQSAPRIRDENAFFGYFWAVAANTYKNYLRRKKRFSFEKLDKTVSDEHDFTQEILKAAEYNTLRRELALLSREYRECTVAYYIKGLSCAETASRLHISLEMVKYYLFKTRKILKEGISMDREFGPKSYNPAKFRFSAIFSGSANAEYQHLFDRKLPGNILLAAYYTPMTIRELAIELGVASAYLEDEIALLERYRLITALPGGKYQTHLVIFTESYLEEFYRTAEPRCLTEITKILTEAKSRLPKLRSLGFPGSDMEDDRLLWACFFELVRKGFYAFESAHEKEFSVEEQYDDGRITRYGSSVEKTVYEYDTQGFAGYCQLSNSYALSYADFHSVPSANWCSTHFDEIKGNLAAALSKAEPPMVPIIEDLQTLTAVFEPDIENLAGLYDLLYQCALSVMQTHAPKNVAGLIPGILAKALFFKTVGFLGAMAVKSKALAVPDKELPLTGVLYRTNPPKTL